MQEPFDPYWHWLAIPPADQPPDHYRLLGLRRFEGDTELIAQKARSRIDHVRGCRDAHHAGAAERILEHLAAARDTLLSPKLKAQYDSLLVRQQAAQRSLTSPRGEPAAMPAVQPTAAPSVSVVARRGRKPAGSGPSPASLIVCGAAGVLALALGLAVWLGPGDAPAPARPSPANTRRVAAGPGHRATSPSRSRENTLGTGRGDRDRGGDDRHWPPVPAPRPRGPETMADLMGAADDAPAGSDTVTGKLAAARRAMWSRDLAAARRHTDDAQGQARTPTERDESQRVGKLLASLEAFWAAVGESLGRLEGAEELPLGDRRVLVVEADRRRLIVRDAGQNVTFAIPDLPEQLALVLAARSLPRGSPTAGLHVGSFQAIDKRGDRHEARRRWEQAGPEGRALLAELPLAPLPEAP